MSDQPKAVFGSTPSAAAPAANTTAWRPSSGVTPAAAPAGGFGGFGSGWAVTVGAGAGGGGSGVLVRTMSEMPSAAAAASESHDSAELVTTREPASSSVGGSILDHRAPRVVFARHEHVERARRVRFERVPTQAANNVCFDARRVGARATLRESVPTSGVAVRWSVGSVARWPSASSSKTIAASVAPPASARDERVISHRTWTSRAASVPKSGHQVMPASS